MTTEVIDREVPLGGFINPDVPPLTEKENVFNTPQHNKDEDSGKEVDQDVNEVEPYDEEKKSEDGLEHLVADPFLPFDDLPPESNNILTIRAVFVGLCCGALVNASNVYLGLKSGWTFSANLFGSIIGFAVLKSLSRALPENFPILGGNFGARENNIVQTAAMASGGLSNVFVSAFPALYQLELMGESPKADYWRIVSLTAVAGYFGFFFATPLRKFFIVYVARELRLVFPTSSATAMTIRSMHQAVSGEVMGKLKMKALSISFAGAFVLRIVSQYAPGILWDWHFFTWFFIWGKYKNAAIAAESWGWFVEFTPAFIGSGMLVGLNVSLSMYFGGVLAWGIIGPALIHNGAAVGIPYTDDPKWSGYMNFMSLSKSYSNKYTPSPRYWLLWPGVLMMITVSFTELFLQYKVIFFAFRAVFRGICKGIYAAGRSAGKELGWFQKQGEQNAEDLVEDSATPEEQVKVWMWSPGLILSIICICVVMGVEFDMPVGMSILSIVLAFFFSFLAIQCTGVTDITPLTAASKASQIVLGGATKGEQWQTNHALKLNLLGGSLANMGANQSTDLVCDFRTGFLLRTSPMQQWLAQGVGTIVAVFLAPAMFGLFAEAYPCIIDINADTCPFGIPSVAAWRATAVAVVDPTFPIPTSSGIFAIVMGIFGSAMVFVRHFLWVGKWEWMRKYHPNMMCIGLSFTLNSTVWGTAMVMGALPSYFWAKKNPKSFDIYGYAIAAGLIAGEGIGGVVNALFQIVGISGPSPYGTNIACPADSC